MLYRLSLSQKKHAIERGLSPYLEGSILQRAVEYWEVEYGDKPSFVLNRFLSEICTTEALKQRRKEMLRALLEELSNEEKQGFEEVVEQKHPASAFVQNSHPFVEADLFSALSSFVNAIAQAIEVRHFTDFDAELKVNLKAQNILGFESLKFNQEEYLRQLMASEYSHFLTAIYEVYCEYYGPTKADQVYAKAKHMLKMNYPNVNLHQLL